jgi:hypothetical protein
VSRSKAPDLDGIFVTSLASKESRRLLPDLSNAFYVSPPPGSSLAQILFIRNSVLMAQAVSAGTVQLVGEASPVLEGVGPGLNSDFFRFSVSGDGSLIFQAAPSLPISQLNWFERSGLPAEVVGQPGYMSSFSISPDGKRVALTRYRTSDQYAGSDVWLHELEQGTESRFSFKGLLNGTPVWSPDGSSIAFGAGPGDTSMKRTNGVGQEELLVKDIADCRLPGHRTGTF